MKVICPNCGHHMVIFGVSERGEYKYYCNKCNQIDFTHKKEKNE